MRQLLLLAILGLVSPGRATWPEKLAQQPGNTLVDFLAYRHVSVVHFDVRENAVSVGFKFTVKEEKTGGIGECSPRNVTINVKSGSLPLVRPDGSRIEAKLLENRRRHYTIDSLSNGDEHVVNIVAPPPGDWYVIAYRSWTNPDTGKIKQQGLGASCETLLDAEMSIELADTVFGYGDSSYTAELTQQSDSAVMQFRVPKNTAESTLNVQSSCGEECLVSLHVTTAEHILGRVINSSEESIEFRPYDNDATHYVTLRLESGNASRVSVGLENDREDEDVLTEVRLTRKTLPDFFLFDYEHLVGNSSKPAPMNLTTGSLSVLRFKVGGVYDTGGTLSLGLRLADKEDKQDKQDKHEKEREDKVVVVGCVSLGYHSPITSTGNCVRDSGGSSRPADIFVANRSSPAFVHVPYPEPGIWHLTLRAYCLDDPPADSEDDRRPCECFEECARNATNCEGCDCAHECDARVESSVASSPCIEGGCNAHGRCVHYMSGGFVFSACHCTGGYRGFDCIDDAFVLSKSDVLARLLMLTLSNLAFVGAIYVAIGRFYYTESIVYAAVMIFSTFYHACEAGEEAHSFCLMKLSVLQFCDFYNALLSIWVTLVAMASMGPRATSFCQMLGVVVLAVGAEMDRTALWVFLLPAISGVSLVVVYWAIKCRQKGTLQYPARVYRLIYLPIGLIVVFVGLVCYAFLQTRSNYYIVHSLWHVCVAAGVVLLLPKREYMQ
ncbi:post-GPI attachment to proteins factor 6 isoform X2 [Nasonia vitripennis]|nr:post-GPI attachment to proteins factor 6 isoform X2 [Nasonia vitripennis]XP_016840865.1 post-GPI attachment to proteins factor 6 isoform X2 [Nasonia vitripennis]XP_031785171.1 post-GPI attachment to proteins factor 6 isoform X2 [Nasonia vitripennis]XP_031785172.1 post-GPI attachment to proteins factor 6 isoform X2 [Nasonia vitripennis]XP_031785173.1 post-GPI attachment to proteins factor 6 isoform X2 [Nasonia vitripennis]XP_031785174.1 post-GPI attachment to proteins factor 6 isoform X2 [Na